MAVAVVFLLAGCSAAVAPATKKAQFYAQNANLKLLDLPAGWTSTGPSSDSSVTSSTLNDSQATSVKSVFDTLPAACRVLDSTFDSSLVSGPPVGSIAQNQTQFTSASDGNAQISSTVAVFGNLHNSEGTFALYAAPTFPQCLQQFLEGTLTKIFDLTDVKVMVTRTPTASPPAGVLATGFTVSQSGTPVGSQANVSVSDEVVMQSGTAMAFVEAQSATTSVPADAQNVFGQSVSKVAHNLVPPPS